MRIGIIQRGHHGENPAREISRYFEISVFKFSEKIPEILEDVFIPKDILKSDIIISYANHPDINLELVRRAEGKIFIVGKGGSRAQLVREAGKHGKDVILEEICCTAKNFDEEFSKVFGRPEFDVDVDFKENVIKKVKVLRCAFCGASNFVAEKLVNCRIEDAPSLAGYFAQIYPCLASRGIDGKIHLAAKIHRNAIERAIERRWRELKSDKSVENDAQ
ncbi:MAG TPA: hypothetical protein EYP30_09155 [Archaeoglobaceae archaeon]|nr:hypothetical protein [Archaeoglobaceae archaeon]